MESIEGFVAEQLAAWQVPGCAVAAVRDGEVVLAGGWGRRDVKTDIPVTSGTLFAIGSVTKAFTAATVGALVDEGLLDWARPLRDYLPDLRLHDPVVTDRVSVVDFLSHRSGLPRHDLAWIGHPGWSRAELVHRLVVSQVGHIGFAVSEHKKLTGVEVRPDGTIRLERETGWAVIDPAEVVAVVWNGDAENSPGQFL